VRERKAELIEREKRWTVTVRKKEKEEEEEEEKGSSVCPPKCFEDLRSAIALFEEVDRAPAWPGPSWRRRCAGPTDFSGATGH
jgi:hypothetical protein